MARVPHFLKAPACLSDLSRRLKFSLVVVALGKGLSEEIGCYIHLLTTDYQLTHELSPEILALSE